MKYWFTCFLVLILGVTGLILVLPTSAHPIPDISPPLIMPSGGTTVYTDRTSFESNYPNLTFEGIENTNVFIGPQFCRTPWMADMGNTCFSQDSITSGISFHRLGTGGQGPGSLLIEAFSREVRLHKSGGVEEAMEIRFRPLVHVVGVQVISGTNYALSAFAEDGVEIYSTTISPPSSFLGLYSDIPLRSVQIEVISGTGHFDAVLFGLPNELLLEGAVGRTPTCDAQPFLVASEGQTVYPSYTVTNHTPYTLTSHTLAESELGTIFSAFPFTLSPDTTLTNVTAGSPLSTTASTPFIATAAWTATNTNPITASAIATTSIQILTPFISTSPTVLTDSHPTAPQITTDTLTINNTGGAPISWMVYEDSGTRGGEIPALLYDQLGAGTASVPSQYTFIFEGYTHAIAADDFTVPPGQTWAISQIIAEGEYRKGTKTNGWNVHIYEDNNGQPGRSIAGLQITPVADVNGTLTFEVEPYTLSAGRYWLAVKSYVNAIEPTPNPTEWRWFATVGERNAEYHWFDDRFQPNSACYQ